jgi:hypothetical protein
MFIEAPEKIVSPSAGPGLLDAEGVIILLRNVGKYLPVETA